MPEPEPSAEPTSATAKAPWDWRMLAFFDRHLQDPSGAELHRYLRQASGTGLPPIYVLRLTLGAGALEGLLLGLIQGGILCAIFSVFWGLLVGLLCGMIVCKARQSVTIVVLSVLAGVLIEAMGSWLIALYVPFFGGIRVWLVVEFLLFALAVSSLCPLIIVLLYREIRAILAGLRVGAFVGMVWFPILGVFVAADCGVWWALPIGGLFGAILGPMLGGLAGLLLAALGGALVNVNRRTILPTYFGTAGGIALGFGGWFIGASIPVEVGEVIGVNFGISLGAAAGISLGVLLTPRSWKALSFKGYTDPRSPEIFNMSDGRRLADLADTFDRVILVSLLLGQLAFRLRKIHLEPVGEYFRVTFESLDPSVHAYPLLPICTGRGAVTLLKELAGLGSSEGGDSFRRREGELKVLVSSCRVDLHIVFETTLAGDRVTLVSQEDAGASDAAARVADRFLFILRARRRLSHGTWPEPRGLRGIA